MCELGIDISGRLPVVKAPPCNEVFAITYAADRVTPVGLLIDGHTFKVTPQKHGRIHLDRGETSFTVVHHAPFAALRTALEGYSHLAAQHGISAPDRAARGLMLLSEVAAEIQRLHREIDLALDQEAKENRRAKQA